MTNEWKGEISSLLGYLKLKPEKRFRFSLSKKRIPRNFGFALIFKFPFLYVHWKKSLTSCNVSTQCLNSDKLVYQLFLQVVRSSLLPFISIKTSHVDCRISILSKSIKLFKFNSFYSSVLTSRKILVFCF